MRASGRMVRAAASSALMRHQCGSTVIDARGIAGGDAAGLAEGRPQPGESLKRRLGAGILVLVDGHLALARLDRHRKDLIGEAARCARCRRLRLRGKGEGILLRAADLEALGHVLGRDAHVVVVEDIPQAVPDHRIDEFERAHPGAGAQMGDMRRPAHALLAAGNDDAGLAGADEQRTHNDGTQSRAAHLTDAEGRRLQGHPGGKRRLADRILPLPANQDLAEHGIVHLLGIDFRTLERCAHGGRAKTMGGHVGKGAVERTDGGAGGSGDDDLGHGRRFQNRCGSGGNGARRLSERLGECRAAIGAGDVGPAPGTDA